MTNCLIRNLGEHMREELASKGIDPSHERAIAELKNSASHMLDIIDMGSMNANPEAVRAFALAKTNLEQAVMWAVKGYSRLGNSQA